MPAPTVIDLKKAIVYFVDGGNPANRLEIKMDEGNLTFTINRPREYRKNRGRLDTVRDADEEPMDVSVQGRFDSITSSSGEPITISEFLMRRGAGSSLVTTGEDTCAPYCIDIQVDVVQDCGTLADERITFPEFRYESIGGDFQAGQLSIDGQCNATEPISERLDIT